MSKRLLNLPCVTLCCVDNQYPALGFDAIKKTCAEISFAEVLFFTDKNYSVPKNSIDNLKIITTEVIKSIEDYSRFMLKGLHAYVKSSHVLTIQWDGFVIRPSAWQDQFLHYDYIGANWPRKSGPVVGNGGFSLRSSELLRALQDPLVTSTHPEDACICDDHRDYLKAVYQIKFSSTELADEFAFEFCKPHPNAFGFHGMSNFPKVMSTSELMSFIELMPAPLIFNGYFRQFFLNLGTLKTTMPLHSMEIKASGLIAKFDADFLVSDQVQDLIKTFCKARSLRLAKKLMLLRIAQQGWNRKNVKLATRIFLALFFIK